METTVKDRLEEIRHKNVPVIIVGAGVVGSVLLSICKEAGIAVEFFCDSSEKVAAQGEFCGLKVMHISKVPYAAYAHALFIISAASIQDVVERLRGLGFLNRCAGGLLLRDIDVSQSNASIDYARFAIENCILCHTGYLHPDKLFLRSVDVIITERCSLKCKDCSNLMQYYERPRDCDTDTVLRSIDALCAIIDEVMDFRVIGGEVFMNKDWPAIVKRLIDEPKAKRVVLYTNGTIIPDKRHIPLLQNRKVLVIVSDYGALSKHLGSWMGLFQENKIANHILKVDEWLSCSTILPHHRGTDGNRELFRLCCAKNMASLSDGKLFRCPYAANAFRLAAVPDCADDYVDLLVEPLDREHLNATKQKVRNYLLWKSHLKICDYCNGRPLSGDEVQPFVQISKPLSYEKCR